MSIRKNNYTILVEKTDGKRPLGKFRYRWVDNIKWGLMVAEWENVNWVCLAEERPVICCCEHGSGPSVSTKSAARSTVHIPLSCSKTKAF
jgi:hypothetical protein